jgi:hypothetical protein
MSVDSGAQQRRARETQHLCYPQGCYFASFCSRFSMR